VRDISTAIEPLLILSIGLLVGILAFSIISPIYQVVGNV
jgi:type II secretory pathway component PulF